MAEAGLVIRSASPADADSIRRSIKNTLANPDGKRGRRNFEEAAERQELLIMERFDPLERRMKVVGFVEWHLRVDGSANLRDVGTTGEEPEPAIAKRLLREFLRLVAPSSLQAKIREDQTIWNEVFSELPRFRLEGREFSRPHWRNVWVWPG